MNRVLEGYAAERELKEPGFAEEWENEKVQNRIADQIYNIRKNLGLSQREFAKLVGKPQSTIGRIESREVNASLDTIVSIANATNKKLIVELV
ncbi:helix-turn-helix domain-containing protein [Aerococcus viridans]|uniref:helix-turn-helix domain-containing protein n=1 Tax=Aerococcus viridans TaxID=1377 RepID=UPI0037F91CD6